MILMGMEIKLELKGQMLGLVVLIKLLGLLIKLALKMMLFSIKMAMWILASKMMMDMEMATVMKPELTLDLLFNKQTTSSQEATPKRLQVVNHLQPTLGHLLPLEQNQAPKKLKKFQKKKWFPSRKQF